MATAEVFGHRLEIRFDSGEVAGALGDSVTVLPLMIAIGALTDASLGLVLLGFAVFQAVWGLHYGLPMSVEPMKALAGLAIAGTLGYGELVAAGLLAGVALLVAGATGLRGGGRALAGRPLVRGAPRSGAAAPRNGPLAVQLNRRAPRRGHRVRDRDRRLQLIGREVSVRRPSRDVVVPPAPERVVERDAGEAVVLADRPVARLPSPRR